MPDFKGAGHRELAHPRQDAGRRHLPLRRHQHHLVAERHSQRARQRCAQHHVVFAGAQGFDGARAHVFADFTDPLLGCRFDAAQQRAAHIAATGQQTLRRDIRRGGHHMRIFCGRSGDRLPVAQRFAESGDLHMGHRAQHARTHLALKTVEHRQHGDQHRHAQRDANHRDQRNHRNEFRALPRTGVTQTDK